MLIIKKPINLKSRDFECTLEDNFCHRIRGNYMLFTSNLNKEDLLHMVTMPPEVYLAEGNTTTFIQHHSIHENKEVKIDILNNLLNLPQFRRRKTNVLCNTHLHCNPKFSQITSLSHMDMTRLKGISFIGEEKEFISVNFQNFGHICNEPFL